MTDLKELKSLVVVQILKMRTMSFYGSIGSSRQKKSLLGEGCWGGMGKGIGLLRTLWEVAAQLQAMGHGVGEVVLDSRGIVYTIGELAEVLLRCTHHAIHGWCTWLAARERDVLWQ